jgi:hypothetical protein
LPRPIIDTESSRPAYNRRRIRRLIVTLLLAVVVIAAFWFLAQRAHGQESRTTEGTWDTIQHVGSTWVPAVLPLGHAGAQHRNAGYYEEKNAV